MDSAVLEWAAGVQQGSFFLRDKHFLLPNRTVTVECGCHYESAVWRKVGPSGSRLLLTGWSITPRSQAVQAPNKQRRRTLAVVVVAIMCDHEFQGCCRFVRQRLRLSCDCHKDFSVVIRGRRTVLAAGTVNRWRSRVIVVATEALGRLQAAVIPIGKNGCRDLRWCAGFPRASE